MKIRTAIAGVMGSANLMVLSASVAMAQGQLTFNANQAGFKITDLSKLIQGLLNMVLFVAAILVFAYMIWGGIQWITSGGDKGKTEEARNKITAAVIGLAVLAASYALFSVVLYFLGISNPLSGGAVDLPKAY